HAVAGGLAGGQIGLPRLRVRAGTCGGLSTGGSGLAVLGHRHQLTVEVADVLARGLEIRQQAQGKVENAAAGHAQPPRSLPARRSAALKPAWLSALPYGRSSTRSARSRPRRRWMASYSSISWRSVYRPRRSRSPMPLPASSTKTSDQRTRWRPCVDRARPPP